MAGPKQVAPLLRASVGDEVFVDIPEGGKTWCINAIQRT
jgi:hypothetical protein